MDYTIVDKPSFDLIGKALRVSMKDGENMREIPKFWDQSMSEGLFGTLMSKAKHNGILGDVTLGVCTDFAPDMSEFTYLIAVEKGDAPVGDGLTAVPVPALTWAVFKGQGALPDAIQNLWGYIMGEFLPSGDYAHAAGPDLEIYPASDPSSPGYTFEVWVPVVKK